MQQTRKMVVYSLEIVAEKMLVEHLFLNPKVPANLTVIFMVQLPSMLTISCLMCLITGRTLIIDTSDWREVAFDVLGN